MLQLSGKATCGGDGISLEQLCCRSGRCRCGKHTSMNKLASLFDSQGKYEAAEPLFEETLRLSKKVLGEEHSQTLTSMNNLASLQHVMMSLLGSRLIYPSYTHL
ncbi:hypothetical protein BKA61DRAFT_487020 [Leptodontidium sp. MPI-SDFR-AT-0119]|nr:hypothetical protein BKA61DRAFT_487020 [Leptodontidium sp. MPI-SDFR-AT-0119]